jgi:hypothetical protein
VRYRVFGGVLTAPFPFPELREAPSGEDADWSLDVVEGEPEGVDERPVGEDELAPGIHARLGRVGDRLRLHFDDTGVFDVYGDGRITWFPAAGCDRELVRVDILGRVLAVAGHEQGLLALHGSGVAIDGRAVGFLAPKGSGKSTLAIALASRGARLLTDDTLPVDVARVLARPGVHSVRLWDDAADRFSALGDWRVGLSDKRTFDALPDSLIQHDAVPLGALYELLPRPRAEVPELVRRTRLPAAHAAIVLMQHSKLGALLRGESRTVFERAARVASDVPVYSLELASDLASLGEAVDEMMRWHR